MFTAVRAANKLKHQLLADDIKKFQFNFHLRKIGKTGCILVCLTSAEDSGVTKFP